MYAKIDNDNKVVALISHNESYLDDRSVDSANHFRYVPQKLKTMTGVELAQIGLVRIIDEAMPEYDSETHSISKNILKVGDVFAAQTWSDPQLLPLADRQECIRNIRAGKYPDIGDQLDAIWKQLNYDRLNGRDLITEADGLLGDILAVKAANEIPTT